MERHETTTMSLGLLTTPSTTTANTMIKNNNKLKRPASAPPNIELLSTSSGSTSSNNDESSLDDSLGSRASKKSCGSSASSCSIGKGNHKRVSWDQIHTREYTLVVGDHPMCQDGLPVSLGWDHADCGSLTLQQQQQQHHSVPLMPATTIRERQQSYAFPRRLSYEERRDRLLHVSNLTLDQIKNDEMDLVVRTLRESWEDAGEDVYGALSSGSYTGVPMIVGEQDGENEEDALMYRDGDPLADMMGLVDCATSSTAIDDSTVPDTAAMMMLPGLSLEDDDLGDISNFEWTDKDENDTRPLYSSHRESGGGNESSTNNKTQ
jgi:hypothetical protein